jgi:hypothetical protein
MDEITDPPVDLNPEETELLAEYLLRQDFEDDGYEAASGVFKPEHPRWRTFIERGGERAGTIRSRTRLSERRLVSQLSEAELGQLKHRYLQDGEISKYVTEELTSSTIAWNKDGSLLLLYLKRNIPLRVQKKAWSALELMRFDDPRRAETRAATAFNARTGSATVKSGELLFGFMDRGYIQIANPTREQETEYSALRPLLRHMNAEFARVLPSQFAKQNRDIPAEFRQFGTAFSTTTILKSAPASVHKDSGNGLSLTCMTTVSQNSSGGELCLLEYGLKIPVKPGDVLIAATAREWHVNLTPVKGTKYSIVCYFRQGLASPARLEEWYKRK